MNSARRLFVFLALAMMLTPAVSAQIMGRLLYSNRVGRAISLEVIEASHPTLMSLRAETGDAETFRVFVLAHAGQQGVVAKDAHLLTEKAPQGWRTKVNRSDELMKTPDITFWRYTSGWVLPARFRLLGQDWHLISADLPARMFVPSPGKGH